MRILGFDWNEANQSKLELHDLDRKAIGGGTAPDVVKKISGKNCRVRTELESMQWSLPAELKLANRWFRHWPGNNAPPSRARPAG